MITPMNTLFLVMKPGGWHRHRPFPRTHPADTGPDERWKAARPINTGTRGTVKSRVACTPDLALNPDWLG